MSELSLPMPTPALKNLVLQQVTEVYPCTLTFQVSVQDPVYKLVDVAGTRIRARAHPTTRLAREQRVWAEFPADRCVVIADDGWRPRAVEHSDEEGE